MTPKAGLDQDGIIVCVGPPLCWSGPSPTSAASRSVGCIVWQADVPSVRLWPRLSNPFVPESTVMPSMMIGRSEKSQLAGVFAAMIEAPSRTEELRSSQIPPPRHPAVFPAMVVPTRLWVPQEACSPPPVWNARLPAMVLSRRIAAPSTPPPWYAVLPEIVLRVTFALAAVLMPPPPVFWPGRVLAALRDTVLSTTWIGEVAVP